MYQQRKKGHTALDRHLLSVYRQLVQVQSPLPVVYKNTCYTETLVCILRPFSFLTCHQVVMEMGPFFAFDYARKVM